MTTLTAALSMIGGHIAGFETIIEANAAYQNVYARARSCGVEPGAASQEAWEAFCRIALPGRSIPPAANEDFALPDSHLNAVVEAALNGKESA